jgi:hypothetical protein
MMIEAQRSASSVFIVGVKERPYAKQEGNFRGSFPKRELAGRGSAPACHGSRGCKHHPLLGERFYGRCFVVLYIEDGVELRDLQQVVYFLGEVEQLEFAALVFGSGEGADQLADA